MRRVKRFLRLPVNEQWLLVESSFLLAGATLAVAILPFSIMQKWAKRKLAPKNQKTFSPAQIRWAISVAGRIVPGATCFAEALAAQFLVGRCGYHAVMRIGVCKRENGEFAAHAWVESEGMLVAGGDDILENYDQILVF